MKELSKLALEIIQHLEVDAQYIAHVDPSETERIAAIRSAGRAAARHLGYQVQTAQTDPGKRDDGKVVVAVMVTGGRSVEDQERLRERDRLLTDEALRPLFELRRRKTQGE